MKIEEEVEEKFKCQVEVDGRSCGRTFFSKRALRSHVRQVHNIVNVCSFFNPTNVCIVCETIFASEVTARRHLARSIQRGYCVVDLARALTAAQEPKTLHCPGCEHVAGSWLELRLHLARHLPFLPDIRAPATVGKNLCYGRLGRRHARVDERQAWEQ